MRVGPHVERVHADPAEGHERASLATHIRAAAAAAAAVDFRVSAVQVFVAGPRGLSVTLRDEEADELKAHVEKTGLEVIAHGTYMDMPWGGNHYIAKFIRAELELCTRAGIAGLVVHLGKPAPATVAEFLPRLEAPGSDTILYLEIPHLKPGASNYETPEKLAELFRAVRGVDPDLCRFGLCIDTAHLWSCGVDLQSYEAADDWIGRLEAVSDIIPYDRIIIHLNDSLEPRGGGTDRHAALARGNIWGDYGDRPGRSGLAAFVDFAERRGLTVLLERKPREALLDDYAILHRLAASVRLGGAEDGGGTALPPRPPRN